MAPVRVDGLVALAGPLADLGDLGPGITDMPWRRFAVFNALGAALWVGVWASVG